MARYDDKINQLLGEYVLAERNRNPQSKVKGAPKGAEQKFDKREAEDEDDEDNEDEDNEDLKENIEGIGLGGMMGMGGTGIKHAPPGWKFVGNQRQAVDEEDEDKTGEVSDRDLVKNVKKKHTAGQKLLTRAAKELKKNKGSLTAGTRDALARDEYASWSDDGREEGAEDWGVGTENKGACTPMSKASCTPRRKAFAQRAKKDWK